MRHLRIIGCPSVILSRYPQSPSVPLHLACYCWLWAMSPEQCTFAQPAFIKEEEEEGQEGQEEEEEVALVSTPRYGV